MIRLLNNASHRNNLSLAQKRRYENQEERNKNSISQKGRIFTDEHKKNISLSKIGKKCQINKNKAYQNLYVYFFKD
jgi:hypothetical protein